MKIVFVLSSISRANGGISESVRRLALAMHAASHAEVKVLGLRDPFTDEDLALWKPLAPRCLPVRGPRAIGYAPGFRRALAGADPDVTHVAGLWMYPSFANERWARRAGRPYVVSPHGMLDPWALNNSAWKKKLAARLFERRHLEGAACLHALCEAEVQSMRAYGLANPVCVVPSGMDLPAERAARQAPPWTGRFPEDRRVLLFLGRLHPKKGLRPLLQAWEMVRPSAWQLVIAGWDQGGHREELEAFVRENKLVDHVCFCGPLHGEEKSAAYAAAQAFVLPSFSEGLPMTALEAWAHGLPVLMTAACNLPEGFTAGAALEISTDPVILAPALARFFGMSREERAAMGRRGRELVATRYRWDRLAEEMAGVYRWVAGQGPRPGCVRN